MNNVKPFTTFGFLLERCYWTTIAELNNALKENGIELQHSTYTIIRLLYQNDGLCQRDVATLLHRDAAGIKRLVDQLVERGFVERRPLSGSKNGVFLTQKALDIKPQLDEITTALPERICEDMSPEMYHNGMAFLYHLYESRNNK